MRTDFVFTSESVTPGHPDKMCDQISDAAIDAFLRQDPLARVNVECAVATGVVFLAARFAADARIDLPQIARGVIADVGYVDDSFDARSCSILTSLVERPDSERAPPETAGGKAGDADLDRIVAEDHANVFGFACTDTDALMPAPIWLAQRLARALDRARIEGGLDWLRPDAKAQVAVEYRRGQPFRIHSVTITTAVGSRAPAPGALTNTLRSAVVEPAFAGQPLGLDTRSLVAINVGAADLGGPARHAGLTGRKNGIDTYGEFARQSGAALSGKDPSRIDRTGAYAARHAAKNIVAAGLAARCEVHLAYAIGTARPLSVQVETYGTGKVSEDEITRRLVKSLDFRPAAIARRFALRHRSGDRGGFYRRLAVFGQVGRADMDLPWERTDAVELLR